MIRTMFRTLRPLLIGLVTAAAALSQPRAGIASAARGAVALSPQPDGSTLVEADSYRALLGPDGNLHSLKIAGAEMLDDRVAFSLGAFFHADGPRRLEQISRPRANVVQATDGAYVARYEFQPQGLRVALANHGPGPVAFLVILSPNVTLVTHLGTGEAAAAPATEGWGEVRFSASSGAYLELTGGSRIWGPWLGRQVWELSELPPGQNKEIALRVGAGPPPRATLKQLVGMRARWGSGSGPVDSGQPLDLTVSVMNRSDRTLHGLLSLELSGSRTELVVYSSSSLDLPARESRDAGFRWRVEAPDFYTARASLSVAETEVAGVSAVAGHRVDRITPAVPRPADFQEFWNRFLKEVGEAPPQFRLTLQADQPSPEINVWVVQYSGLRGKTISGWYLVPSACDPPLPGNRAPAILYLSGYGARPLDPPTALARDGYVVLAIDVRGNRVDRVRARPFEDYCTEGIMSPDTYVYREIAGHALRGIRFLLAREEIAPDRVAVVGASEGGGVGLILAAVSSDVNAVVAAAPMLCDFPLSLQSAAWPYAEIARYRDQHSDRAPQIDATLSYFDAANFAPQVKCPVLLTVGFRDRVSLPAAVYGLFNLLPGPKQIRALTDVGHEGGGDDLWAYGLEWLAETLRPAPTP